jgi:succinylglutamate desuccinylase
MKKNQYYPIIKTYGKGKPIITIIGCLHGDELVGKKVINTLAKERIINGTLITIIGNPPALKKRKRFIQQDLNRSFYGKKTGKIEERIAYKIMQTIKKTDYVIDIHSTSSNTKDLIIIKKNDPKIKRLLKIINPKRVVLMPKGFGDKSLINFCSGLSFEYGRHKTKDTYQKSLNDIKKVLISSGIIKGKKLRRRRFRSTYYEVYDVEKKPRGFIIKKGLENFKLIRKGDLLGRAENQKVFAREDFYPVLFGEKAYLDIIGFKARKIKLRLDIL